MRNVQVPAHNSFWLPNSSHTVLFSILTRQHSDRFIAVMIIRRARPDDLGFFVDCVTHEGWLSETRTVFDAFFAHSPEGCFVGEINNRPVGMCVASSYGNCGFIGELIVVRNQRGCGLGTQFMKHAIAWLQAEGCQSIYLDGDIPAVPIYERLGFRAITQSLRFLGHVEYFKSDSITPICDNVLPTLLTADRLAFAANRSFFLKRRLETFPQLCLVEMKNELLVGYIMGQPGHGVVSVGPWLVTDSSPDPLGLLRALAEACGNQRLRIGVLESNRAATALLRSQSALTETEPSIRMVLGPDCGLGASAQLYAIGAPSKG